MEMCNLILFPFSGVFCYDFLSSLEKLEKCSSLPKKEEFFNRLTNSHISDDDYKHAKKVFKSFKFSNMLEYLNLYMKLDTYLLADIFLKF